MELFVLLSLHLDSQANSLFYMRRRMIATSGCSVVAAAAATIAGIDEIQGNADHMAEVGMVQFQPLFQDGPAIMPPFSRDFHGLQHSIFGCSA